MNRTELYHISPGVLMQYSIEIPYGKTLKECIETRIMIDRSIPYYIILSQHGRLISLNLSAALIFEEILADRSVNEICETILHFFVQKKGQSEQVKRDVLECINVLFKEGWIDNNVED